MRSGARDLDRDAIATSVDLLARHRARLLRYFVRRTGSWHLAEDIVAEVALQVAVRGLDPDPQQAWIQLVRRGKGVVSTHRRTVRRARANFGHPVSLSDPAGGDADAPLTVGDSLPAPGADVPRLVAGQQLAERVAAVLAALPEDDRLALAAAAEPGGVRWLAERLGVSRQTAQRRIERARTKLLSRLSDDDQAAIAELLRQPSRSSRR